MMPAERLHRPGSVCFCGEHVEVVKDLSTFRVPGFACRSSGRSAATGSPARAAARRSGTRGSGKIRAREMGGSDVIRIQQCRGCSFVGCTGVGCLRKNCGAQDEEGWNRADRIHSGPSLSRNRFIVPDSEPSSRDAFVSVDWRRSPEHHARGVRTANLASACLAPMTGVGFRSRCKRENTRPVAARLCDLASSSPCRMSSLEET